MTRRLHPHASRTFLGLASDRDILGNGARRPAMSLEAHMIKAIAASHIVGVLLSKRIERGAIRMAHAGAGGAEQQCEAKMDDTKPRQATHDTPQNMDESYNLPALATMSIRW